MAATRTRKQRRQKWRLKSGSGKPATTSKPKRPNYHEYIASKGWKKKRKQIAKKRGYCCEVCEAKDRPLQLHHLTYKHLGQERKEELKLLCDKCHENCHEADGVIQTNEIDSEYRAIFG